MKVKKVDFYCLDIDELKAKFGDLVFVNTFCVLGESEYPSAVYRLKNPDISRGYKEFLIISTHFEDVEYEKVTWMTRKEINKEKFQVGVYCPKCKEVIHSTYQYDNGVCSCKYVSIDGGKEYARTNHPECLIGLNFVSGKTINLGEKK